MLICAKEIEGTSIKQPIRIPQKCQGHERPRAIKELSVWRRVKRHDN